MRLLGRMGMVLLLAAVRPLVADADAFTGAGPLPVRNFQPIQLIFLNLPFERAQVLPAGALEVHLESAESNEIATNQEGVQALLKFETNRTVLGGSYGAAPDLQVGLDVP